MCRRFRTLATHPSLLRDIELSVWERWSTWQELSGADADARLAADVRALGDFLARRAAPHLRRLQLRIELGQDGLPGAATRAAFQTFICRLAAHCGAFGALEELSITNMHVMAPLQPWWFKPLARSLRRLR